MLIISCHLIVMVRHVRSIFGDLSGFFCFVLFFCFVFFFGGGAAKKGGGGVN